MRVMALLVVVVAATKKAAATVVTRHRPAGLVQHVVHVRGAALPKPLERCGHDQATRPRARPDIPKVRPSARMASE